MGTGFMTMNPADADRMLRAQAGTIAAHDAQIRALAAVNDVLQRENARLRAALAVSNDLLAQVWTGAPSYS